MLGFPASDTIDQPPRRSKPGARKEEEKNKDGCSKKEKHASEQALMRDTGRGAVANSPRARRPTKSGTKKARPGRNRVGPSKVGS